MEYMLFSSPHTLRYYSTILCVFLPTPQLWIANKDWNTGGSMATNLYCQNLIITPFGLPRAFVSDIEDVQDGPGGTTTYANWSRR
jgi:hypothetical protein